MSNDIDHISKLQRRLYARDPENIPKQKFGILRPLKENVDSTWGENDLVHTKPTRSKTVSGYKRLFIVTLIFFMAALGVALFSVYKGAITLSSKNVEVNILGNSFVAGGESLPIQIDMVNKNSSDLVNTQITLSYPKGSTDVSGGGDVQRIKKEIGTISSGKTKTESFAVVLYGEQGTSRTITATLEYTLSGSNAVFVKEKTFAVMINASPVSLVVDAPTNVSANQPFNINIRTSFIGDTLLDNAVVRVEYPNGYSFVSALPAPNYGNNTWALGDLVKGTNKTISIKGKMAGEQQDEKSFRIYVGSRTSESDPRIDIAYNSVLHSVVIAESSIESGIVVNNSKEEIISLTNGSPVSGFVSWKNNAPIAITRPIFTLFLNGENIDTSSIIADGGYYDATEKSISWSNETNSQLTSLESGATGQFPFSFNTKQFSSGSTGDIGLTLSVKGVFPDRGYLEENIPDIDKKTIRFASKLQFASQGLYSIGPIKNSGPFPPRVDQYTTYTIQWILKPSENGLNNATATAILPFGVVWNGSVSPSSEVVTYAPDTRTVSWNIGNVTKSSTNSSVRSVYFQIKTRPTKNQIGFNLNLLGETKVQAIDSVTNTPVTAIKQALTNELGFDPAYSVGKEKVLP
jgi:hypothetical protein